MVRISSLGQAPDWVRSEELVLAGVDVEQEVTSLAGAACRRLRRESRRWAERS